MNGSLRRRVLMRADAGASIGFGHFVRTSALAAYLQEDFECVFASHNPSGPLTEYQLSTIRDSGAGALDLRAASMEEADEIFLSFVRSDDIVVLDNYYFITEYQRRLRERCRALVCVDDVHDRHFVADVVMTFCPLTRKDFSLEPYTRFYGGIDMSFLRQPFLAPVPEAERPFPGRRMVMAIGGADPFHLTDKMIRVVKSVFPEVEISVVAGQTVTVETHEDELLKIYRRLNAEEMARLFDASDWGLFPASTICVEAFARKLPVVAGHYVGNQEEFYAYGVEAGWFAPLDSLLDDETALQERLGKIRESGKLSAPDFDFLSRRDFIIDIFKSL